MKPDFSRSVYGDMRSDVMQQAVPTTVRLDGVFEISPSFLGMRQVYSDKTETTLNFNAVVAYPVHVVHLSVTKHF